MFAIGERSKRKNVWNHVTILKLLWNLQLGGSSLLRLNTNWQWPHTKSEFRVQKQDAVSKRTIASCGCRFFQSTEKMTMIVSTCKLCMVFSCQMSPAIARAGLHPTKKSTSALWPFKSRKAIKSHRPEPWPERDSDTSQALVSLRCRMIDMSRHIRWHGYCELDSESRWRGPALKLLLSKLAKA